MIRHPDEAAVDAGSKSAQKVVLRVDLHHRRDRWIQDVAGGGLFQIRIVGRELSVSARQKAFLDEGVADAFHLDESGRLADDGIELRKGDVSEHGRVLRHRIEHGCNRADLGNGRGPGTAASVAAAAACKTRADFASDNALAAGRLVDDRGSGGNAAQGSAGLGAYVAPFGVDWAVAGDFEIEIVFERHGDRVLNREIQFPGANEAVQAAVVLELRGRDVILTVWPCDQTAFRTIDDARLRLGRGCGAASQGQAEVEGDQFTNSLI